MSLRQRVVDGFRECFGASPECLVRAPGRVNLIGEHTDYNAGFVLPMAIDCDAWIALRRRRDQQVRLRSLLHDEDAELELGALARGAGWPEYLKGVLWALREAGGSLVGWEGVTASDVPLGAGLSSSAAFTVALARACYAVSDRGWEATEAARLCQRAENEWVGVQCGVMDPLISALGRAGHALRIDCRSLACHAVPLPAEASLVVLDTGTRRGLRDSAYNERRAQCEQAARAFGVAALRDVSLEAFERRAAGLDERVRRRARHVITENARTLAAASALEAGDAARVGALMNASHTSLRDDFEVSSPELDVMVEKAREQAGCHGARMTGAGFGGCAVAWVAAPELAGFTQAVADAYQTATGLAAAARVCRASAGAELQDP